MVERLLGTGEARVAGLALLFSDGVGFGMELARQEVARLTSVGMPSGLSMSRLLEVASELLDPSITAAIGHRMSLAEETEKLHSAEYVPNADSLAVRRGTTIREEATASLRPREDKVFAGPMVRTLSPRSATGGNARHSDPVRAINEGENRFVVRSATPTGQSEQTVTASQGIAMSTAIRTPEMVALSFLHPSRGASIPQAIGSNVRSSEAVSEGAERPRILQQGRVPGRSPGDPFRRSDQSSRSQGADFAGVSVTGKMVSVAPVGRGAHASDAQVWESPSGGSLLGYSSQGHNVVQPRSSASSSSGSSSLSEPSSPQDVEQGTERSAQQIHGDVYLDGAVVGRWISRLLSREAERAPAGRTGFDIRRGRLLPGPTLGGL